MHCCASGASSLWLVVFGSKEVDNVASLVGLDKELNTVIFALEDDRVAWIEMTLKIELLAEDDLPLRALLES